VYVPYPVARLVQHEQEGHEADRHALASNFIGGNQMHLRLQEGQTGSSKKASHKGEKGKKCPGTESTARVPKKVHFEKHCNLCKKHGGTYTMPNTRDCHRFKNDGKGKSDFCAANNGRKKAKPVNQNFAQLTKKSKKLEKMLKKSEVRKRKSTNTMIVIPTPNRELGWVALGYLFN
jgi:hypothetical protein